MRPAAILMFCLYIMIFCLYFYRSQTSTTLGYRRNETVYRKDRNIITRQLSKLNVGSGTRHGEKTQNDIMNKGPKLNQIQYENKPSYLHDHVIHIKPDNSTFPMSKMKRGGRKTKRVTQRKVRPPKNKDTIIRAASQITQTKPRQTTPRQAKPRQAKPRLHNPHVGWLHKVLKQPDPSINSVRYSRPKARIVDRDMKHRPRTRTTLFEHRHRRQITENDDVTHVNVTENSKITESGTVTQSSNVTEIGNVTMSTYVPHRGNVTHGNFTKNGNVNVKDNNGLGAIDLHRTRPGGLHKNAIMAIIIGSTLAGLKIIAGVVYCSIKKQKKNKAARTGADDDDDADSRSVASAPSRGSLPTQDRQSTLSGSLSAYTSSNQSVDVIGKKIQNSPNSPVHASWVCTGMLCVPHRQEVTLGDSVSLADVASIISDTSFDTSDTIDVTIDGTIDGMSLASEDIDDEDVEEFGTSV